MKNKKVIHFGGCSIEIDDFFIEGCDKGGRVSGGIWLRNPIKRMKFGWEFCESRIEFSFGPIDMWMWFQK